MTLVYSCTNATPHSFFRPKIPGLSIDRAGVALVGAGLMVASGVLSLEDAYRAIDLDTITLLLG
jgi:Na+/H+ antiporter NhaD/arsenite permease-like protein